MKHKFFNLKFIIFSLVLVGLLSITNFLPYKLNISLSPSFKPSVTLQAGENIDVWWPTSTTALNGVTPFKGVINGRELGTYDMYWQVDNGQQVLMGDSYADYPHKEASVDVSNWTWKKNGPYTITFIAKEKSGRELTRKDMPIYIGYLGGQSASLVVASTPTSTRELSASVQNLASQVSMLGTINMWWPTENATLKGTQPFKAVVKDKDANSYRMFWRVDNGVKVEMPTSYTDYPHKEAKVDVSKWNWQSSGAYSVTISAEDFSGNLIAEKKMTIYAGNATLTAQKSASTPGAVFAPAGDALAQSLSSATSLLSGSKLYVNTNSSVKQMADSIRSSRPTDAAQIDKIANQPEVAWFGNWSGNIEETVRSYVSSAASQNAIPVMVAYNIPQRDCGGYSAGGSGSASEYQNWINAFARGIGNNRAAVILEPDALAAADCLNQSDQETRYSLIKGAVSALKATGKVAVYIDAGHPRWKTVSDIASRLIKAGVAQADGFSLNISNFFSNNDNIPYGNQVSAATGGKHFVIDTSRNGNGSSGEWCNPWGRALGIRPTTATGSPLIDAFLWIKKPGESDGNCNGGPNAGNWWLDYALDIARNSPF